MEDDNEVINESYLDRQEPIAWNNTTNAKYYDSLVENTLPAYAVKGGLDSGCDIDLIRHYISSATSILEVGAGYGRVIKKLIDLGYDKRLVAIERCEIFYQLLETKFDIKAEIIHSDIKFFHSLEKFDLILWLWSGLCDFAKHEQIPILEKVFSLLKNEGILVLDTMPHTVKPANASILEDQSYLIPNDNNPPLYGYTPSYEEIAHYADVLGCLIKHIDYQTTTGRSRILHILQKKN